jgi:hypothetical protein
MIRYKFCSTISLCMQTHRQVRTVRVASQRKVLTSVYLALTGNSDGELDTADWLRRHIAGLN